MNWFIWRQHRKQFLVFGALLILFAVLTILTGNQYWHIYQHELAACAQNPATPSCSDLGGGLPQGYGLVLRFVFVTSLVIPLLLGFFLGSPLFSKEYEDGTNKLVWTQSVSRRKWLTAKLVWTLLFAGIYGLAISLLVSWWARTTNALDHSRFDAGQFDVQGIMPLAYSIFFTAVGFAVSAWFRKTLLALAVTLGLFIGCQMVFAEVIRAHYMTPVTITSPMGPGAIEDKIPTGAWVLSRDIVDKNGRTFDSFSLSNLPDNCRAIIEQAKDENGPATKTAPGPGGADPIDTCLNNAGFHQIAKYQPPYRYWDFQRIETGIFLGMTALAVGATYWLVLRRDA